MSSIIVSATLLVNAAAVINFKLASNKEESFGDDVSVLSSGLANLTMKLIP